MAEDPTSSGGYGRNQVRITLKPTARFSKWNDATVQTAASQSYAKLGVSGCVSFWNHNRNPFVHLLLEDEQVDFIEDTIDARKWFQLLRPQAAIEFSDGL